MRKAASRCSNAMALLSSYGKLPDLSGARRQLGAARRQAAAPPAASMQQQQQDPGPAPHSRQEQQQQQHRQQHTQTQRPQHAGQQPRQQAQQAHHAHEYDSIRRQWHVKRTELRHYPEEVQERIRSSTSGTRSSSASGSGSRGRSSSSSSSTAQARPLTSTAASSGSLGGSRAGQAGLGATLGKLAAALEYEKKAGCINVVGSIEKVPVADWAARQLREAAAQLQEPAAAQQCLEAAEKLAGYAALPSGERYAVLAVAESAVQQAQYALQVGSRTMAGRQARYQPQPLTPSPLSQQQQQQYQRQQQQPQQQAPSPGAQVSSQPQQQQPRHAVQAAPASAPQGAAGSWAAGGRAASAPTTAPVAAAATAAQAQPQMPAAASMAAAVAPEGARQAPPAPAVPAAAAAAEGARGLVPADRELDAAAEAAHEEEVGQQVPTPEGEEYVMSGNRRIKAATAAFRRSFAEAAAAMQEHAAAAQQQQGAGSGGSGSGGRGGRGIAELAGGEQRSAQWFQLRERRLTASAFSKAIGLFSGDRPQLWAEKVGMVQPFQGNAATAWGTSAEPRALETYQGVTGQSITSCMFQVKHDDPVHGWLGASPDGIIESLSLEPAATAAEAGIDWHPTTAEGPSSAAAGPVRLPPQVQAAVASGAGPLAGPGRGILEIKCPHNKGQPELAVPPQHATWYYMPQVQGLMYIFDCEWCNLYIWTSRNGSAVYHIRRDRQYWGRLWGVLADFWWNHVVPARQEFQAGRWEEVEQYRPAERVDATEELRQWSKRMALQAPVTYFKPQPQKAEGRK